MERCLVRAA
jgi:adenylate kinase family enzyme